MRIVRSQTGTLLGMLLLLTAAACSTPAPRAPVKLVDESTVTAPPPVVRSVARPPIDAAKGVEELRRAIVVLELKDYQRSEADFEELVKVLPEIPEAYFNLAWVKQQLGKHAEVGAYAASGLKLRPNEVAAYLMMALSERELGRFLNAESIYLAALGTAPDDDRLHLNLGILYDLYLQRPGEALEHYRQYQRLQKTPNPQVGGWIVAMERAAGTKSAVAGGPAEVIEIPASMSPAADNADEAKPSAAARKGAAPKKTRKAKK